MVGEDEARGRKLGSHLPRQRARRDRGRVETEGGRGEICQAIERAIIDAGMRPVNVGPIPTPALAYYALSRRLGSIMVTGSHIPFHLNGYKLNTSAGELLKEHEGPVGEMVGKVRARVYAQPFDDSRQNSGNIVDIFLGRRRTEAETQAAMGFVWCLADCREHMRRRQGSGRTGRPRGHSEAAQIERNHQGLPVNAIEVDVAGVGHPLPARPVDAGIRNGLEHAILQPVAQRGQLRAILRQPRGRSSAAAPNAAAHGTFSVPGRRSRS